jgi:gliding motility-associated-like protein
VEFTYLKKLNNMRLKTFLLFFTVALFSSNLVFSQLLVNKGSTIKVTKGAVLYIDGGLENNNSGIIDVDNIGGTSEIIVKENFVNYATAEGSGYYKIYGDWVNNNTFNAGSGTVFLEGANQLISGSHSTNFYNLTLNGSGIKTLGVNQSCSNVLSLNDLELNTLNYKFYVTNPATTAITRVNGFVSSTNGGFLSRTTNSNGIYLFPVGSSTGTNRYRPVEIQPTNTSVNTYTVRFANVDPTTEFYNTNQLASDICEVNSNFYHQINRSSGTSSANVSVFYDPATDGIWEGLANWKINQWQIVAGSQNQTTTPLSKAIVNNWNDFSSMPYSLYRNIPTINITHPGDLCQGDAEITLTATPAGGTWSGTGITDAINGTYNPNTEGTHTITYTIAGTCGASNSISIIVKPTPTINITDPGDFCSTDPSSSFTATPTGGTWSGTGISADGTFNPSTANIGPNTITYTVTQDGCTGEESIVIDVFDIPDATITSTVTTMCSGDEPITLTATTPGGNWTGTGVTTDGIFDPEIAGLGDHTITYTVGTGTCLDDDQIIITVNSTPVVTITNQEDLCSTDAEVTLSATPTGGTWSGTGITNQTNGTFNPETAGAGEHTITYTVTQNGCTGEESITINVIETPDATITSTVTTMCTDNDPITLTATTPGGNWTGTGVTTDGVFDPEIAGVGEHTITYTVSTGTCTDNAQITITVSPTPDINITKQDDLCLSDSEVTLSATPAGGTWSGPGITNATNGTFNPEVAGPGEHTITYTVESPCLGSATTVITVSSPTQITIINYVCSDTLPIFFNANIDGGTWSGNGIVDANTGEFDPEVAGVGEHTITYAINNPCGGTVTTVIQVYQRANAEILPVDTLFVSDLPVFVETVETGGTWSGTGIDETTGLFTPNIAGVGDHQVYYTIPAPCGDIDSTVVIVIPDIIPDLIIPDVLTPNNDGYNDTWRIQGIQAYEKIEIYIFNRWGDEVFTYSGSGFDYNDPAKQWDGTFKGKLLPFGTYVYVLILNDETSYKSTVTIIR